jgi:8-oxo-dGTP pyrophosphatase MutT (NUDIX family)
MDTLETIDTWDTPEQVVQSARAMLARYLAHFPGEAQALHAMRSQLEEAGLDALVRSTMRGHLTTSALVYDPDVDKILLIHHRAYNLWLPPGGHYEFPGSLWESAAREVLEETAAVALLHDWCARKGIPLDIDTHPIPAYAPRGEGEHFHHDVTYLATASSQGELEAQIAEVHATKWVRFSEFLDYCKTERTVRVWRKLHALRNNGFHV